MEIEVASETQLRILTLPTEDEIFARFVARTLADVPSLSTPRRLRIHLRPLYPRLIVQPRQLVEPTPTWYVFRDGRIRPRPASPEWWRSPDTPTVTVDEDGSLLRMNAAFLGFVGATDAIVGQDFRRFAPAGTGDDVRRLFEVILASGGGETPVRFRALDGSARDAWIRLASTRSGLRAWVSPYEVDPDVPEITPLCWPSLDLAFVGMAERYIDRIDAASPEAAVARLGRLLGEYYPMVSLHLRPSPVPGLGRVVEIFRDGQPAEIADRWWEASGSAHGVIRDSDGRYVEANEALAALHGVTVDELLVAHAGAFAPVPTRPDATWLFTVLRRVGQLDTTTLVRRADGAVFNVLVHSVRDGAGPGLHAFAMRAIDD